MKESDIARLTADLRSNAERILKVLLQHPKGMRPVDLKKDPSLNGMHDMSLHRGLKRLMKDGSIARNVREVEGKPATWYAAVPEELAQIFSKMRKELNEEAERLQAAIQQPGLSVVDRGKRLIYGVHTLLAYQRDLTLMAMKLAISADTEQQAAHRFLVLMDTFTVDAAGNAMWLCWLNKDVAQGVLEAILQKKRILG